MFSQNTLLLTFTGRTSGRRYATPVNYAPVGDELLIISRKDRTWWRNLRGGAPVMFRLKGRTMTGQGVAFEDEAQVKKGVIAYLEAVPHYAKYFEVRLDEEGHPSQEDIARTAQPRVLVKIKKGEL
jgi:hypothetical protein